MLEVFYGSDSVSSRAAALAAARELDAHYNRLESNTFLPGMLRDAVEGVSLFGGHSVYVLDTPSQNVEFQEELESLLQALSESPHHFIILEEKMLAPQKKIYQKYSSDLKEFSTKATEGFNVFSLSDALADRDKKKLWLLLQEAKQSSLSEEELIGTLWWQIKSMLIASQTNSAAEAGMKDYPYDKAKKALSKYSKEEIKNLAISLLTIYHQGHQGEVDLDIALEQWVLSV